MSEPGQTDDIQTDDIQIEPIAGRRSPMNADRSALEKRAFRGRGTESRAIRGYVQREVLAAVADGYWWEIAELTGRIYGQHENPSDRNIVRRAIQNLARKGLVETGYGDGAPRPTRRLIREAKWMRTILAPCESKTKPPCWWCRGDKPRHRLSEWDRKRIEEVYGADSDELAAAVKSRHYHEFPNRERLTTREVKTEVRPRVLLVRRPRTPDEAAAEAIEAQELARRYEELLAVGRALVADRYA